ncbi:TRAF-like family protein [Corchorus capsularis]|uniref:TRAF-like family protein n=1 Tax=Corchorus capsularis TaxID=210143 RepID=A0A1R3JWX4_COCAP|nr:TRAF-like family protein [Corchorus capsularis]
MVDDEFKGKAAMKKLKTLANSEEISSLGPDETDFTNQNLPSSTNAPEDPTEDDMHTFFTRLESELASHNYVSSQEEAKEALAKIEEALNMAPADFSETGKISPLNKAFKVLSRFDCSSTLTDKQKTELLAMEETLERLPERVVKLVQDRNELLEKESKKLKLIHDLEHSLNRFKDGNVAEKQIEQKLAALHEQEQAERDKQKLLAERKVIFKGSKDLKMELEALREEWPDEWGMEQVRKLRWRIEKFSSIKTMCLYSSTFSVGANKWRILIYPRGEKYRGLSIYLNVADSATLPLGWSIYAQCRFGLVNQIDHQTKFIRDGFAREFNSKDVCWGYPAYMSLSELHDPNNGYLLNDACLVEVQVCTDKTIDLLSHGLMVETIELPSHNMVVEIDSDDEVERQAAFKKLKTMVNPEEISSPGQEKIVSTIQNLPTPTIGPEAPTEEDMDTFFTSLESELAGGDIAYSQEEAKEALAKIEEALNMAPSNFYETGKISSIKQAFKVLSRFDCSSVLTVEQKTQLLAMEENFKQLPQQLAKAMQHKNRVSEKESMKLKLTRDLEHSVNKFKDAREEVKQIEQKISALHEQVCEAKKNKEKILAETKGIFKMSKELKMELEALGKELAEYEGKAKVADEDEKKVAAEWSRMKYFICSLRGKI